MFYGHKKLVKYFFNRMPETQQNFLKDKTVSDFILMYCTDLRLIFGNVLRL